jgi:hypothetical protein
VRFVPAFPAAVCLCFYFPLPRGLVALVMAGFIHIPRGAVLAHYAQIAPGSYAVVSVSGSVLAPSFYELRNQYTATATINGSGGWVILSPVIRSHSISQEAQPTLF